MKLISKRYSVLTRRPAMYAEISEAKRNTTQKDTQKTKASYIHYIANKILSESIQSVTANLFEFFKRTRYTVQQHSRRYYDITMPRNINRFTN
jgi:hypothetical protein